MERSDIRDGLTRILRSLSTALPKAGPVAQFGLPGCCRGDPCGRPDCALRAPNRMDEAHHAGSARGSHREEEGDHKGRPYSSLTPTRTHWYRFSHAAIPPGWLQQATGNFSARHAFGAAHIPISRPSRGIATSPSRDRSRFTAPHSTAWLLLTTGLPSAASSSWTASIWVVLVQLRK